MAILSTVDTVASNLSRLRHLFVNVYFVRGEDGWVLTDAALPGSAGEIFETAESLFGAGVPPRAILLTHGHFDHVGALEELLKRWDVPLYAHELELPHLTGARDYPPPDPLVGGGAMALMSFAYPNKAADFSDRVTALPADGSVPFLHGWRWLHTPGHTGGHVSFFRDADRCLIAGDAFVTVKQESLYEVVRQDEEVHGPPAYFTPDWAAAKTSVERLAALRPTIAATGHGKPMQGQPLAGGLEALVRNFDEIAVPGKHRDQLKEAPLA